MSKGVEMNRARKFVFVIALAMAVACTGWAQSPAAPNADFAPFQQWMGAILTGDAAALKGLYSTDPAAQVRVKTQMHDADADISFWIGKKVRSMNVDLVRGTAPRADITHLILRINMVTASSDGKPVLVTDDQVWQKQGEQWKLVSVERTDAPSLKQPSDMKKEIYPASADAHAELKEAEEKAAREHKRLLLVFGANWCFDCHVLDLAFHGPELAPIVAANYEVVHVDLGPDEKKNADLVRQFDIPLNKGIPAMAVADSDGKLIVSQKNGEVEDARQLTPEFLAEFLNKWKPQAH
ncbi:MAG TPA: thioredoxin family protein [Bryobacteraceae bacterium]|nr:thioredoxin family protein [Bryobacteraceae bacterium]